MVRTNNAMNADASGVPGISVRDTRVVKTTRVIHRCDLRLLPTREEA